MGLLYVAWMAFRLAGQDWCQIVSMPSYILAVSSRRSAACMEMYIWPPPLLALQWPPQPTELSKLLAYLLLLGQMVLHLLSVATMAHSLKAG
jgi:hypothetical protein